MRKKMLEAIVGRAGQRLGRVDMHMLINLRATMYTQTGLYGKKIVDLINEEFGTDFTISQLHHRNKLVGESLRDAKQGNSPFMEHTVRMIRSWPSERIKRFVKAPLKKIEGKTNA